MYGYIRCQRMLNNLLQGFHNHFSLEDKWNLVSVLQQGILTLNQHRFLAQKKDQ